MQDGPLPFSSYVRTQPAGVLKGSFRCQARPEGVLFESKQQPPFMVAVGTPTEHLKQNKLLIHLPDYRMEVSVTAPGSYNYRLARDLALYLGGRRPQPRAADYRMPWYFWVLVLLPAGIMVITRGGALAGGFAGGLAAANYGLLQHEDWPLAVRIAAVLGIAAAGYAALFALINAAGGLR
jgi:hypothetical protein